MIETLIKFGYVPGEHDNEWIKKDWTFRFFPDGYEIYNDPVEGIIGKYYSDTFEHLSIEEILLEADKFMIS